MCYSLSRVRLFATPWTIALQAPLSMRFSRQEYWSGSPCPNHTLEVSSDLKLLRDYSKKLEDKAQSPVTQHTILHSAPVNKGKDAGFISPLDFCACSTIPYPAQHLLSWTFITFRQDLGSADSPLGLRAKWSQSSLAQQTVSLLLVCFLRIFANYTSFLIFFFILQIFLRLY